MGIIDGWTKWKGTIIMMGLVVFGVIMANNNDFRLAMVPLVGALVVIALDKQ